MRLRLEIDITYEPEVDGDPAAKGATINDLRRQLFDAADYLSCEGMLTGSLLATVASKTVTVAEPIEAWPDLLDRARRLHANGDDLEIDDNAEISEGEEGTWVQAWVWVPN